MYEIEFIDLISVLNQNYQNGALIKIFSKKDYALSFERGEVCLGTLQYYRTLEDKKDGRTDKYDSVTNPVLIGSSVANDGNPITFTRTDALTGLAFCMFYYDKNNTNNVEHFRSALSELGCYICIIDFNYADTFYWDLFYSKTICSLSHKNDDLITGLQSGGNNNKVCYSKNPDYSGFQKRLSFAHQQEYRYIFSLKDAKKGHDNINELCEQFIFKTRDFNCFTFHVNNL